jgi:hypothetical protein
MNLKGRRDHRDHRDESQGEVGECDHRRVLEDNTASA